MDDHRPTLRFRAFRTADAEAIGPWLQHAGLGIPPGVATRDWGQRVVVDPLIIGTVAFDHGAVCGFSRLDLAPDRTAEITLIVDPRRRRAGIGNILLEHALREARRRRLRRLVAVVDAGNRASQEFFLGVGFERTAVEVPGFVHLERVVHGAGQQPPLEIVP